MAEMRAAVRILGRRVVDLNSMEGQMPWLSFDDKHLTDDQLSKLDAVRESLGRRIADRAFAQWLHEQSIPSFDEKELTKDELGKLKAVRKSLGPVIADRAFAEWLSAQAAGAEPEDSFPPRWSPR